MGKYMKYQKIIKKEIQNCIEVMECLPILFIGSGLSKRYFNAPNWDELLGLLTETNPRAKPYAYYKQNFDKNTIIASELAKVYNYWAWEDGKIEFEDELFSKQYTSDIFLKNKIAKLLENLTPKTIDDIELNKEIKKLQAITPHAVITTNYDTFLELIFPEYETIIGQKILRTQYQSIGEIFKIHGCVSEYSDLVITNEDYLEFEKKQKYLSAKLLTYFLEHPIFIFGYGIKDPNIQSILSDIDEILVSEGELVPNIFLVQWQENIDEIENFQTESLVDLGNGKSIRIKTITTTDMSWIYDSLAVNGPIENVNPKLLRALLARTYDLVRTDVPRRTVEINYAELKSAIDDKSEISKIYGITSLTNPSAFNIEYLYTLTDVGKELGFNTWHKADQLISRIKKETGICIKESDNKYHIAIMNNTIILARKYSKEMISLLKKVMNGEKYEIDIL